MARINGICNQIINNCNCVGQTVYSKARSGLKQAGSSIKNFADKQGIDITYKGKVNGKTLIGAGILTAIGILAIGCINTIHNKLKTMNKE